jgi:hypothetical protein
MHQPRIYITVYEIEEHIKVRDSTSKSTPEKRSITFVFTEEASPTAAPSMSWVTDSIYNCGLLYSG